MIMMMTMIMMMITMIITIMYTYICVCVCAAGCSGAIAGGTFCPSPRHSPNTTTEKRVPVLARCRSDGRLVVAREGHGVFTVSHYRRYHKTCRLGAKENGPS